MRWILIGSFDIIQNSYAFYIRGQPIVNTNLLPVTGCVQIAEQACCLSFFIAHLGGPMPLRRPSPHQDDGKILRTPVAGERAPLLPQRHDARGIVLSKRLILIIFPTVHQFIITVEGRVWSLVFLHSECIAIRPLDLREFFAIV